MRKIKKLENVVVPFSGTEIAKGPIFDGGNIVFGNNPKTEVYYFVKKIRRIHRTVGTYNSNLPT